MQGWTIRFELREFNCLIAVNVAAPRVEMFPSHSARTDAAMVNF
jgi:hypothetical protein